MNYENGYLPDSDDEMDDVSLGNEKSGKVSDLFWIICEVAY